MNIFRRPDYQSDATKFLNQLKADRPELDAQQQYGRSLLWDRHIDPEVQAEYRAGKVPQKAYVYQTNADE